MRKCIIGINSSIVQDIKSELSGFDYISHKEIPRTNFNNFKKIYLFSWSHNSLKENIDILNQLPMDKLIFVSTIAVYANSIKMQWNKYPRNKFEIEKKVLSEGGSIVRFGVCDKSLLERHVGVIPYTSKKIILGFLQSAHHDTVTNLFDLKKGSGNDESAIYKFSIILNNLADLLPAKFIFQAPIELFIKSLGLLNYGYTNNTHRFFGNSVQIGFGALGSVYWKKYLSRKEDIIVSSPDPDICLDSDGFRGMYLGKKNTGLSKYWHGVYVTENKSGHTKNVPFFVIRPKLPHYALNFEVDDFRHSGNSFTILLKSEISKHEIKGRKIILAAGAIENCILMNKSQHINVTLTDHEIGFIGTIDANSIKELGYLSSIGPLVFGRKLFLSHSDPEFMLDFRPFSNASVSSKENLYSSSTRGILYKLIKKLSLSQINEAIFNKFGVAFATKNLSVFAQIKAQDCIRISPNGSLSRKRISYDLVNKMIKITEENFQNFSRTDELYFVDGIHAVGGRELLKDQLINDLMAEDKLVVLNSPTNDQLGPSHHTQRLINEIRKIKSNENII